MKVTFLWTASVLTAIPTIYVLMTSGFWPLYFSVPLIIGGVVMTLQRKTTNEQHGTFQLAMLVILMGTMVIVQNL